MKQPPRNLAKNPLCMVCIYIYKVALGVEILNLTVRETFYSCIYTSYLIRNVRSKELWTSCQRRAS